MPPVDPETVDVSDAQHLVGDHDDVDEEGPDVGDHDEDEEAAAAAPGGQGEQTAVYKKRWYICAVFAILGLLQASVFSIDNLNF